MNKELESFKRIKTTWDAECNELQDWMDYNDITIVENGLKRLEAIDNSNPSEALECLDYIEQKLGKLRYECKRTNNHRCDDLFIQENIFATIKQALLKAQEPKHYLKWEDLEFNDKEQRMNVSLNGHPHRLCYYRNMFGSLCMIDNTGITIWEDNKNFFNDLHLERVEE